MTPVIKGIYGLYNAGGALKTALTGGLHFELQPQGTSEPYATFFVITGRPEYFFGRVHEIVTIQFDIYATSNTSRISLYGNLTSLYDDARPTATGYTSIIMERKSQQFLREGDQNQIYRVIVEYQAIIEK